MLLTFLKSSGKYKDHKNPPKFRPIVNKKDGPTYDLEKYMADIYKKILSPSTNSLSSTSEFIQYLWNINCKRKKKILVSFDVVNLYPSTDINEMQVIIDHAFK